MFVKWKREKSLAFRFWRKHDPSMADHSTLVYVPFKIVHENSVLQHFTRQHEREIVRFNVSHIPQGKFRILFRANVVSLC